MKLIFSLLVWCDLFIAMAMAVLKREKHRITSWLFRDTYDFSESNPVWADNLGVAHCVLNMSVRYTQKYMEINLVQMLAGKVFVVSSFFYPASSG